MGAYSNVIDETHLCEEVPGVEEVERYFIWHQRKTVWKGPTKASGEQWAAENGITIDRIIPFAP